MIVGLGNPGRKYSKTRHNLGFIVLDKLASIYRIKLNRKRFDAIWGEGLIEGEKAILVKSKTFMNLSGKSVKGILKGKGAEISDLLVLCDDMDLELGKIRVRPRGSAGGHKGLSSIVETLGTDQFTRVRLGIGKPGDEGEAERYVLSTFSKSEIPLATESIKRAAEAAVMIIKEGVTAAMNKYNTRNPKSDPSP